MLRPTSPAGPRVIRCPSIPLPPIANDVLPVLAHGHECSGSSGRTTPIALRLERPTIHPTLASRHGLPASTSTTLVTPLHPRGDSEAGATDSARRCDRHSARAPLRHHKQQSSSRRPHNQSSSGRNRRRLGGIACEEPSGVGGGRCSYPWRLSHKQMALSFIHNASKRRRVRSPSEAQREVRATDLP